MDNLLTVDADHIFAHSVRLAPSPGQPRSVRAQLRRQHEVRATRDDVPGVLGRVDPGRERERDDRVVGGGVRPVAIRAAFAAPRWILQSSQVRCGEQDSLA